MFILGVLILLGMCCYCGLLIYATYYECDPLTTKVKYIYKRDCCFCFELCFNLQLAKAKDQLLPLLVMDILGNFPGLPGLFVAGVFSAALRLISWQSNYFTL